MKLLRYIIETLLVIASIIVFVVALVLDCIPLKITREWSSDVCFYMSRFLDWVGDNVLKIKKRKLR